jgi:SET domain-containing protein
LKRYLKVKKSSIHGCGLFARKSLARGTVLGKCRTRPNHGDTPNAHTLWLDDEHAVDVLCKFRYINHSKKPNVVYYDDLTVVALKPIAPGEELVHDYGDAWD